MQAIKDIMATKTIPTPSKTGDSATVEQSPANEAQERGFSYPKQLEAIKKSLPPRYKDIEPDFAMLRKLETQSVLLTGAVGSGKTRKLLETMTAYLIEHCQNKAFYYFENGYVPVTPKQVQGLFLSVPMVLFQLKEEFDHHPQGESLLERMIKAPVLFLDDLGAEKASEWVKEQLYIVINERYNWVRPVLLTTNLTAKEIADNYGDRFASRIVEMCEIVNYGGTDKRIDKRPKSA